MNPSEVTDKKQKNPTKKITPKRIAAIIGILLIAALYVGGLILLLVNPDAFGRYFAGWLGSVIGLPILIWLIIWSLQQLKKRRDGEA
ncbi:MAG: hypothetical protein NC302_02990 [Bacteroidales bacterium]|nr:hypothetical protein [Bacteroidales bacterium]MCM1415092.1 hypothetical protein [bacterium]MCM1424399.1 hypothetical protein [bacterium]